MRNIIISTILLTTSINLNAVNSHEQTSNQKARQDTIELNIEQLKKSINNQHKINMRLEAADKTIMSVQDSIYSNIGNLKERIIAIETMQSKDRLSFKNDIKETNTDIATSLIKMDTRTIWGGILLLCAILGFSWYLYVKKRKDHTSINEIQKAQDTLQTALTKMQEYSVKLDNQILTLIEKQISSYSITSVAEKDHSLALKVADEIVRIELNLARMNPSVKGYKQLSKAVERIKNNFKANGYEIIDMLGMPYNEGMKVVADFVPDETLKEGEQIITGVTKPQINYNGKMIQSAQITVSQNI